MKLFESLHRTLGIGLILAFIAFLVFHAGLIREQGFWQFLFRWVHVWTGILWIGLLYYFNFVQIPSMPKIPDAQKPAVGKVIAPTALFLFRWSAAATVLLGLITAALNEELVRALTFRNGARTIGTGMWLALVMAFNVWFIIWPHQKRVLGFVGADAGAKKKSARTSLLASRVNTMLSVPMLYCMVAQQNVG